MGGGNAIVIKDKAQWDEHIKGKKTVIVDFTATWCGPCKLIGPVFAALSVSHPSLVFLTVDVDANEDGEKKDELVGASKEKLAELVNKYTSDEKTDHKKL